jgi:hypothetical protein
VEKEPGESVSRSPGFSPGESGSHAVDHTSIREEEIRGYVIITARCTCGGDDHHWIKYGPFDESWVEVKHS